MVLVLAWLTGRQGNVDKLQAYRDTQRLREFLD